MVHNYCVLKKDETVKSAAQKLFAGVVEGYLAAFTNDATNQTFDTEISEDEDGLNYDYGDIAIEFENGKIVAFTTSEWSRINIIPSMMIRKV